jgi:hypothetical protein
VNFAVTANTVAYVNAIQFLATGSWGTTMQPLAISPMRIAFSTCPNQLALGGQSFEMMSCQDDGTLVVAQPTTAPLTGPPVTGYGKINVSEGYYVNGVKLEAGGGDFVPLAGGLMSTLDGTPGRAALGRTTSDSTEPAIWITSTYSGAGAYPTGFRITNDAYGMDIVSTAGSAVLIGASGGEAVYMGLSNAAGGMRIYNDSTAQSLHIYGPPIGAPELHLSVASGGMTTLKALTMVTQTDTLIGGITLTNSRSATALGAINVTADGFGGNCAGIRIGTSNAAVGLRVNKGGSAEAILVDTGAMAGRAIGIMAPAGYTGVGCLEIANLATADTLTSGNSLRITGTAGSQRLVVRSSGTLVVGDHASTVTGIGKIDVSEGYYVMGVKLEAGGGAKISDTAPASPSGGDLWWRDTDGQLAIWYPQNGGQWVGVGGGGGGVTQQQMDDRIAAISTAITILPVIVIPANDPVPPGIYRLDDGSVRTPNPPQLGGWQTQDTPGMLIFTDGNAFVGGGGPVYLSPIKIG